MDEPFWDGITQAATLSQEIADARQRLADRARAHDWIAALAILEEYPQFINCTRPGGGALYAVLHQAAYGGAPVVVVEQLLTLGAWRTLRDAKGERPVDIAKRRGHAQLAKLLEPVLLHDIPNSTLQSIQTHFYAVITGRVASLVREQALRLPLLEPLLEMQTPRLWFPVPGMYGGFSLWLDRVADSPILVTESWMRVVGGSGQRHIVSPFGSLLIAEGFV